MLGGKNAAATLAVSDLQRARDFYENTLGLEAVQEPPGAILYRSGNSAVLVYPSEYAGTNKATAASWAVGDEFDSIVTERPMLWAEICERGQRRELERSNLLAGETSLL